MTSQIGPPAWPADTAGKVAVAASVELLAAASADTAGKVAGAASAELLAAASADTAGKGAGAASVELLAAAQRSGASELLSTSVSSSSTSVAASLSILCQRWLSARKWRREEVERTRHAAQVP